MRNILNNWLVDFKFGFFFVSTPPLFLVGEINLDWSGFL